MSDRMNHLDSSVGTDTAHLPQQSPASRLGRRGFLTTLGFPGAALGAGSLTGCSNDGPINNPGVALSVNDVLNFALNLEYLEATFYSYVATGSGLPAADLGGNPGTVSGGAKVNFTNPVVARVAAQLATEERQHVELLRAAISGNGGTPVDLPALNLAALGAPTNDATFLALARQLEGVGVSAYAGGAQYLVSNPAALNYAAQILHVEAQHAGFLRELCIVNGVTSGAVDSLDASPSLNKIFNTDATTGLSPVRTTSQVLQISYGAAGVLGAAKGGFFPNGFNGPIAIS